MIIIVKKKNIKDKIVKTALIEFAEKGYEHASTNNIVKKAEVGKGMLFYYFKNKADLYRYLVDYSIEYIEKFYAEKLWNSSNDFIERCIAISKIKMEALEDHPEIFYFIGNSYLNDEKQEDVKDAIQKELKFTQELYNDLYKDLDTSNFRRDIDPQQLAEIIQYTIDGYEKKVVAEMKGKNVLDMDLDSYWKDFYIFMDNIKKIYYQNK